MQVLFTFMLLWVTVTMGKRMAAVTESQTLVKDTCLSLPFTNSVITHSHFPSVLLSWRSDFNFSGSTFCPYLTQPKGLPALEITIWICRIWIHGVFISYTFYYRLLQFITGKVSTVMICKASVLQCTPVVTAVNGSSRDTFQYYELLQNGH